MSEYTGYTSTDFFLTKKEQLESWCRQKGFFSSVDLTRFGLENMYLRAPRTARDFVHQGIIRRLSNEEASFRGRIKKGNQHIAWYEYIQLVSRK